MLEINNSRQPTLTVAMQRVGVCNAVYHPQIFFKPINKTSIFEAA